MRKWIDLFEANKDPRQRMLESDNFDFDDEHDEPEQPISKYSFLNSLQKKYLDKNKRRKDRVGAREQNRREYDDRMNSDSDGNQIYGNATHKSEIGYKPMKIPLIRFGRFGKVSSAFVDEPDDEETPWDEIGTRRRHEKGVSCYKAYDNKDGTFTMIEPDMASTWNSSNNPFVVAFSKYKELYEYLTTGKPMDLFLIYGHWIGEGKNREYLSSGSDGEPLLDISKPYKMVRIAPEKIMVGRMGYIDYMLKAYRGLEGLKKRVDRDFD